MAWLVLRPMEGKRERGRDREREKRKIIRGGGGQKKGRMGKRLKRKGAREEQNGTGVWQQKEGRAIQLKGQWILRV